MRSPDPLIRILEGDETATIADAVGSAQLVLDCGCGDGRIAQALTARSRDVWGIEARAEAAHNARRYCTEVIQGSIAENSTWPLLPGKKFDAAIFSHVLEHLTDPEGSLRLLQPHLDANALLVIVLPNIATWRVRLHLLFGNWDYQDDGPLDRTHVRFYTARTAQAFLESAGLTLEKVTLYQCPSHGNWSYRQVLKLARRTFPLLFTHSFIIEARCPTGTCGGA